MFVYEYLPCSSTATIRFRSVRWVLEMHWCLSLALFMTRTCANLLPDIVSNFRSFIDVCSRDYQSFCYTCWAQDCCVVQCGHRQNVGQVEYGMVVDQQPYDIDGIAHCCHHERHYSLIIRGINIRSSEQEPLYFTDVSPCCFKQLRFVVNLLGLCYWFIGYVLKYLIEHIERLSSL